MYTPAMFKALMSARSNLVSPESTVALFGPGGWAGIEARGRLRPFALEGNQLIKEARGFVDAYGHRLSDAQHIKLI